MREDIVSRKQALALGLTHYFTGKPCKQGHLSKRSTAHRNCLECHRLSMAEKRSSDPLSHQAYLLDYKTRRNHVIKDYGKRYYDANKETMLRKNRKWCEANKDRRRQYNRQFRESDHGRAILNAHHMQRRATKLNATPPWADLQKIEYIYATARSISVKTGVKVQVDHYFPLRGKTVCGLHTHENLRVITKAENKSKKNKHPDDWEREKQERGLTFPSIDQYLVTRPSESA